MAHTLNMIGQVIFPKYNTFGKEDCLMNWENRKCLCQDFARILGGMGSLDENGVCLVQKFRTIRFRILGRPTRSPLVTPQFFTFEDVDNRGRALI